MVYVSGIGVAVGEQGSYGRRVAKVSVIKIMAVLFIFRKTPELIR
jgi:hypothetical protein